MTDEMQDPVQGDQTPPETPETPSEAAAAWRAVVAELDTLGEAIGRWAKAAVNDPENKRRVDELSSRLGTFVDDVGATVKGAGESEVGQSFKEAADKTGEAFRQAGEKVSEEVGPRLAGAFKTMGDKLRGAAERMEQRTPGETADADAAPADAPAPPADPTAGA